MDKFLGKIRDVDTVPADWRGKIVPILKVWTNLRGQEFYDAPVQKSHDGTDLVIFLSRNQIEPLIDAQSLEQLIADARQATQEELEGWSAKRRKEKHG